MWRIQSTNSWQLSASDFGVQHPDEMSALYRNLTHYSTLLKASASSKAVEAMYLHGIGGGVVAIDQSGMKSGLIESMCYVWPDDTRRVLYLLLVGKASEKDSDMEYCKQLVFSISSGQV